MNDKETLIQLLDEYFFNNSKDVLQIKDIQLIKLVLSDYIAQKKDISDKEKKITKLLVFLYNEVNIDISKCAVMIHDFIEETANYQNAKIFKNDAELAGALKNRYMFDLIEKIRFAKMQKESLRDTSTYNRHIEKALTEMRNDLSALFELGADYAETLPVIEKYYEFNRYVNTKRGWNEFYSLKDYPQFQNYLTEKQEQIIHDHEYYGLQAESIKIFPGK